MARNKRRDAVLYTESTDPFHSIVPYVMPNRTEAEVSSTETFDITDLLTFIEERKADGWNLKLFHCICTAIARTIYHRPMMNIFIAGRKYWMRKDISLSFVARQQFADGAQETLMFLKAKPEMTLEDISKLIIGDVNRVRKAGSNDLDKLMKFVGSLPRFLLEIIFFFIRRLEYHGIVPESLTKGDPNYSTVLLSNLGSIGAGAVYHHLSEYGTCSIMGTIGTIQKRMMQMADGTQQLRDVVDMTITLDERIADGFYFAKSLRLTRYLLAHPDILMQSIQTELPQEAYGK